MQAAAAGRRGEFWNGLLGSRSGEGNRCQPDSPGGEESAVPTPERGLIETVRCIDGAAPLLARHQERLSTSWSSWFGGAPPDLAELAGAAIAATRGGSGLVRITCLAGRRAAKAPTAEIRVATRPLVAPPPRVRVALSPQPRLEPAAERMHKQADRRWVEVHAVRAMDETLVWDDRHGLLEGTRTNLFVLRGRELVTPAVRFGLVAGVFRAELIARAARLRFRVSEREVHAVDFVDCDALLLTGSGVGVVAVAELDGRSVGNAAGRELARRIRTQIVERG